MRGRHRIIGGGAGGRAIFRALAGASVLAFATLAAVSAGAQTQPGWSLPPGETSSPTPAPQGPVDAQNPVVAPSPAPAGPEPVPVIVAPPPPAPSASPSAPASPAAPARRETPTARASTGSAPAEPVEAAPASPAPAPAASPAPLAENAEPVAAPPTAPPPTASKSPTWWWLALPMALLLLALGWRLARKRGPEPYSEPEPAAEPEAAPEPHVLPEAAAVPPIPAPAFSAPPAVNPVRASGALDFTPLSLRISLVYATLRFRLVLTAGTAFPAGRLLADMISAHGSLPQDQQLAPPIETLALLADTPALDPAQAIEIEGELQLPLGSVRPLRQGDATFLVPLVRLAWLGDNAPGVPHLELGCAFTVGVHGQGPALAPLRLDTGPRDFTGLSAREIDAARRTTLLPLDPTRAAG